MQAHTGLIDCSFGSCPVSLLSRLLALLMSDGTSLTCHQMYVDCCGEVFLAMMATRVNPASDPLLKGTRTVWMPSCDTKGTSPQK